MYITIITVQERTVHMQKLIANVLNTWLSIAKKTMRGSGHGQSVSEGGGFMYTLLPSAETLTEGHILNHSLESLRSSFLVL
jgi:hypothetical protein